MVASPVGRWLGAETDKFGKVILGADLSVPGHREVFAIGDIAHVDAPARNLLGIKLREPMILPGVRQLAEKLLIRRSVCDVVHGSQLYEMATRTKPQALRSMLDEHTSDISRA